MLYSGNLGAKKRVVEISTTLFFMEIMLILFRLSATARIVKGGLLGADNRIVFGLFI